jgi:hypothetical protein
MTTAARSGRQRARPRHCYPAGCTIAGFYKYAVEEELLEHSPAAHCGDRAWIMSRTRPLWTATNWVPCSSPPGSARHSSTR